MKDNLKTINSAGNKPRISAKDKAMEICERMLNCPCEDGYVNQNKSRAENLALICVDEIIKVLNSLQYYDYEIAEKLVGKIMYYEEVKTEIEKL